MQVAKNLKYFFILPALLSILSIVAIATWGLNPGIDLAGGSLLQVSYPNGRPPVEQIQQLTKQLNLGEVRVQPTGDTGYILRQRDLSTQEKNQLEAVLGGLGQIHEDQYTSVGPILGAELLHKGLIAIVLVVVCIILFIAFAFRHVSKPVASWKYGVVAIVTLLHDVLVPVGLFAFLGFYNGAEVDALFIVGLLTILGISINDTIVVFDRIRENLALNASRNRHEAFDEVVGRSITQTLARSINTSLTVVIMLAALYFVGPASTKDFSLTLIIGMIAGTYSSIFLASPLLVVWERWSRKSSK
ncbi:MAG TPA: protein translocase subunit SecF [Candidatus Paceibacterota bacterium]|nr:protein translocase subunit SecF [Candidatus Paceibacterota bacterium]